MKLKRRAVKKESAEAKRMLTMQEAMDYLTDKGVPCKSRATFYRLLKDFDVPFIDLNPAGKHKIRRFTYDGLEKVLDALKV